MRAVNDKNVAGAGRKILNSQDGVLLKISKEATPKDVTCLCTLLLMVLWTFLKNNYRVFSFI